SPDRIFEGSDGTTESYLRKSGFSEPFISEFLRPLFSGIFLESKLETSERMFKFVFASMARGDMVLPRGGIQAYPNLIADRIGRERIELSTLATPVDTTTLVLGGREVKTDQVVVAHPQRETADCMNSVWTVYFSAPDNSIKGNYILLNGNYEVGKNAIAHIAVPSNIQPTYSPSGKSLVAVTIVGDAAKALDLDSDESVENQARLELRDLFEKSDTWETIEVFHTKNALPPSGSQSNASSTVNFNQDEVICCGDHTTHGSMEGAIKSADHAANEVVRRLGISA
ncbi:MAG: FAD-dependent oxidoreductase, partial [Candidatus Thermoplasmatota archaeon]|nr:FAD-dependent oxidoreductase [Candidatus Thermoplasmatota archaeon]